MNTESEYRTPSRHHTTERTDGRRNGGSADKAERRHIVKEYKELIKKDGIRLTFTKDALKCIVKKTMDRGTGARGLRAVMEEVMLDIMYEAPDREDITRITITKDVVEGTENPLMKEAV